MQNPNRGQLVRGKCNSRMLPVGSISGRRSGSAHPKIARTSVRSNYHATVNAFCRCLKVIDTFRRLAFIICPKQLMRQAYKHRLKKHRLRGGFAHGPPPRRKMTQQSQLARLLP